MQRQKYHKIQPNNKCIIKQNITAKCITHRNQNIKFKPAFLLKAVEGAPLQADVTANFLFSEKLTLGVAYRWDAAWSALAGFQITDGLMIGYSYDAETTKLANYNSGSHEIFLRFELFNKYKRINSPRFF